MRLVLVAMVALAPRIIIFFSLPAYAIGVKRGSDATIQGTSARPEPDRSPICRDYACMISSFVRARPWARPQTQTLSC